MAKYLDYDGLAYYHGKIKANFPVLENGKIPAAYMPGYVDDILEFAEVIPKITLESTGTTDAEDVYYYSSGNRFVAMKGGKYYPNWTSIGGDTTLASDVYGIKAADGVKPVAGKLYTEKGQNKVYRWAGTSLVEISPSITLGESSSTAYAGDKGKKNATDIADIKRIVDSSVKSIKNIAYQDDSVGITYVQSTNIGSDNSTSETSKTINAATTSLAGVMSADDKTVLEYYNDNRETYLSVEANGSLLYDSNSVRLGNIYRGPISEIEALPVKLNAATPSTIGLMTASDKSKLNGIANNANNYTHPVGSGASKSSDLYKFSTDGTSHISGVTKVTKEDITALGIPAQDTKYTLPIAAASVLGGVKTGYVTSGKNYKLQVDSSGNAFVNVPWTDTATTSIDWNNVTNKPSPITNADIDGLF